MTQQQGQLQAWDRDHGWHNVLEAPKEQKCSKCGQVMTDDECGDEFPEERVCDQCAGYCDMSDEQVREIEFKLAHGVLMSRDEWETSIRLVNTITGRNDVISDEGYEEYATEV